MLSRQLDFNFGDYSKGDNSKSVRSLEVSAAIETLSVNTNVTTRGAIFTRPEVVEFILDLIGYVPAQPLHTQRILEPSFGKGDFLLPIVSRLMSAWRASHTQGLQAESSQVESLQAEGSVLNELGEAICAVELHQETYRKTFELVVDLLKSEGLSDGIAVSLAERWLLQGDFLLAPLSQSNHRPFDFVAGNPPYVRQERIPSPLLAAYRCRYHTLYDRADIYVPFIERSLSLLAPKGNLGFICADRWLKNRYGGPLRAFVSEQFHLRFYVDMVDTPAFQTEVSAYPAITVIAKEPASTTRAAYRPAINRHTLSRLANALRSSTLSQQSTAICDLGLVTNGSEPWLLESSTQIALVRRLEQQFPSLEEAGCRVGIGVATGADKAFIDTFANLDVEPDRKIPLVTTKDIVSGEVRWRQQGVINPFTDSGRLVDLHQYPRLSQHLEKHRTVIANRHCAKKNPANWYRTIDRITPSLALKQKLLIPDIKGNAHIVFEDGQLYPHHNLYYVTSHDWDLRALQAVLLSSVSRLFVSTYSTKLRGGFLRFQAQYLRRIRVPHWSTVPATMRVELAAAATKRDFLRCNQAVFELYGLTPTEQLSLEENGA